MSMRESEVRAYLSLARVVLLCECCHVCGCLRGCVVEIHIGLIRIKLDNTRRATFQNERKKKKRVSRRKGQNLKQGYM